MPTLLKHKRDGSVVQLVRILPCHGRGRGFESRPVRKKSHQFWWDFFVCIHPTTISHSCTSQINESKKVLHECATPFTIYTQPFLACLSNQLLIPDSYLQEPNRQVVLHLTNRKMEMVLLPHYPLQIFPCFIFFIS